MDLNRIPASIDEIFALIAQTPTGSQVLERFRNYYEKAAGSARKVTIEAYPLELVAKLREALGPGQPIGACFVIHEDGTGTIHADLSGSPLGVLAPFLLHEMVHCLNPALWAASGRAQTRRNRDALMLEVETEAFETQHRWIQEITLAVPAYRAFLLTQQGRARVLCERLTSDDITALYGFDVA